MSEEATNNMNLNTLSNTGTAQNRKKEVIKVRNLDLVVT